MHGRPRDRYGRPLSDADDAAFPGVPDRTSITAVDAWREAVAFIKDDLPFHAHEVFEQRWRCCPLDEREGWRQCARWAAALTHLARGNVVGARAIAQQTRASLQAMASLPAPIERGVIDRSVAEILGENEGAGSVSVESSPS